MRIGGNGNNPLMLPMVAGRYYIPLIGTLSTSNTLGVGTFRASAIYIPNRITILKLGADIATAGEVGSKVRLGIYADDGTGRPGTLVVDAGQIDGASATVQELAISVSIGPGWYWQGAAVQNVATTQPTVRTIQGPTPGGVDYGATLPAANQVLTGIAMNSVTGALPAAFVAGGAVGAIPRLIFGL